MEPLSGGSRYPSDKGGAGHPDPEMTGGPVSKKFFSVLRASFRKIRRGRGASPPASPLDPPLPLPRVFDTLQNFDTIWPSLKSL